VAGDKGYDDGDNHYFLEMKGLYSAIRLKKMRTYKKDRHTQVWEQLIATPSVSVGLEGTL
jgi:hypothetical protein